MADAAVADDLEGFRKEVRAWIAENFPSSLKGQAADIAANSLDIASMAPDAKRWCERLGEHGWGAPTWPTEYGGAGLDGRQARVVGQELHAAGAFNPIPGLTGMGTTMVGPTVLEYGTPEQKDRHLPPIARGEVRWCLGLSEPNAGSDLASLTTKAEDHGDEWFLNGSKIWTSGANVSQWCGALVRTDSNAIKRKGISFLLLPMDQVGIETRPIRLISGSSPFCETFFNDARAEKGELLGPLNEGWTVVKRLLQHERASQTGERPPTGGADELLQDIAVRYVGTDGHGKLSDPDLRMRLTGHLMDASAHTLTQRRIAAEAKGSVAVGASQSIMKNSATSVAQARSELTMELMGYSGLGWDGDGFTTGEIDTVRNWLFGKAMSIYGGSYEVQNNIIAKNILGLPETTQKG